MDIRKIWGVIWCWLALNVAAQGQFVYTNTTGPITITGYNGPGGAVAIPASINGQPVISLGAGAFQNLPNLTSVVISNGVTSIGAYAFSGCSQLASVTIPASVSNIKQYAFYYTTNLLAITVVAQNPVFSSVNGILFDKAQTTLLQYPGALAGGYNVPDNVTGIAYGAFEYLSGLTSVVIPGGVQSIGDFEFAGCRNLTNVTLGDGLTDIENGAFNYCIGLTSVTIPASVTNIESSAFGSCLGLLAINVDPQNPVYASTNGVLCDKTLKTLLEYPEGVFGNYTVPDGITDIGEFAFFYATNLTGITIPKSVTNIESSAFTYCYGLTNVTFAEGLANIGDFAFDGCLVLTNVTIPASVTNLGANAFGECYPLAGVYFKGNPPAFGANVIVSRTNVTVYYMPGTTGWGPTYAGIPTALWNPVIAASDGTLGAHAGQFGFNITGTSNISVVVESCTNLAGGIWSPLQTLTLTNGTVRFAETLQTNAGGRYYQLATP